MQACAIGYIKDESTPVGISSWAEPANLHVRERDRSIEVSETSLELGCNGDTKCLPCRDFILAESAQLLRGEGEFQTRRAYPSWC
jgi:hypothetical protein